MFARNFKFVSSTGNFGDTGPTGPPGPIVTLFESSISPFTTTSLSYVPVADLTQTPVAASYFVTGSAQLSSTEVTGFNFGLFINGTLEAHSERTVEVGSGLPFSLQYDCSTQASITVDGTDVVTFEISSNGGTITFHQGSLHFLRVS